MRDKFDLGDHIPVLKHDFSPEEVRQAEEIVSYWWQPKPMDWLDQMLYGTGEFPTKKPHPVWDAYDPEANWPW